MESEQAKSTKRMRAVDIKRVMARITPQLLFLVLALLSGITSILTVPAGGGLDEPQHLARVEQLAGGQIAPVAVGYAEGYSVGTDEERRIARLYGGQGDEAMFSLAKRSLQNFQNREYNYTFPLWLDAESDAGRMYGSLGTSMHVFSNSAVNAPTVYLPYLIGFWLGRLMNLPIFWLVVLMRLLGLIAYILAAYWCVRIIPVGKWPFAVIASSPAVISTISTVTADTVTVILAFMMLVLFLEFLFRDHIPNSRWALLGVVCVLLPISKMAYAPFLGLLVVLPLARRIFRTRASLIRLGAFFAGGIVLLAIWYAVISGINTGAMWKAGIDPGAQLHDVLAHPLHFIKVLAFSLPFYDVLQAASLGVQGEYSDAYFDNFGWFGIAALCIAVLLHAKGEAPIPLDVQRSWKLLSAAFVLVFLLCSCLVMMALYLTFTDVGSDIIQGMQTRYFIPLAPLVLLPISIITHRGAPASTAADDTRNAPRPNTPAPMKKNEWNAMRKTALKGGLLACTAAAYVSYVIIIFHSVF